MKFHHEISSIGRPCSGLWLYTFWWWWRHRWRRDDVITEKRKITISQSVFMLELRNKNWKVEHFVPHLSIPVKFWFHFRFWRSPEVEIFLFWNHKGSISQSIFMIETLNKNWKVAYDCSNIFIRSSFGFSFDSSFDIEKFAKNKIF